MNSRSLISRTVLAVLLPLVTADLLAQQPLPPQTVIRLSPPVQAIQYPEVMCLGCVVPEWSGGYLLHREIHKDPALVTMYDATGKKVLTGRIGTPQFASVSVTATGATHAGGILAGATRTMEDGSTQGFIAETDSTGLTAKSLLTGYFTSYQVCEAHDGTVWALGYDWDFHSQPDADKNTLHHYSFEHGLLGSFVSLGSFVKSPDGVTTVSIPGKSYLRCGKDRVSVYLDASAEYIEVSASAETATRWKIEKASTIGLDTRGFAVTEEGRVFIAFGRYTDENGKRTCGLYELKAAQGKSAASLTPVEGTIAVYDSHDMAQPGTFLRLYGADRNLLVVHREGDGWGLSWAKVLGVSTIPE